MHPKYINIKDYSYELSEARIAKYPLSERDVSKLLVYKNGDISETVFLQIDEYLPEDSLIVFNNTKVIHARMLFQKETGAQIEIFCLEPVNHFDYQLAFNSTQTCIWKCMVGNAKRWKDEVLVKEIISEQYGTITLQAERTGQTEDAFHIKFSWIPEQLHFAEVLHEAGLLPIPPYLNRTTDTNDEERYQTIYANEQGSVAAPTAGLHFTERVLKKLEQKNINKIFITLHVGAGTFKPVKAETLEQHVMHEETVFISRKSIEEILNCIENRKTIVAVGTTGTRVLESLYWFGVKLLNGDTSTTMNVQQWEAYELQTVTSQAESLRAILDMMKRNNLSDLQGSTQIIIAPDYSFKMVDVLITNFHQPENTLMLLVAAFAGNDWKKIYNYALDNDFRFLSYGDSSVLFRA